MKAVIQNFRSGELTVSDVPPPALRPGGLLVRNVASLISAGTEKAVIELAKMNPLQKSRARPDLVRKVLNRAKQEGLLGTAQVVLNLVNTPLPLGYSCCGIVEQVGSGVGDFEPGNRVACAGLGYANHAEMVFIPRNLAARIPDNVDFGEAAFVTVGAIALHGVRQAQLHIGESVVVLGLGLVGQIVAQICVAAGYQVFGTDPDATRVELASKLGCQRAEIMDTAKIPAALRRFTRGRGADAIIICASTPSSDPVALAAELARERAKVVSLGETGLSVPRRAYYEKELELVQSRSYGPGRYDPMYEEQGHDYPLGYVRWTENRNMEAFLDLLSLGKLQIEPLITHRFSIDAAQAAYAMLTGKARESYIGILLEYDPERPQPKTIALRATHTGARKTQNTRIRLGVIGAGQFAQGILLPHLRKIKEIEIVGVATASGITARTVADKYGCSFCTSDFSEILANPEVDAVLIATRHNLHARIASEALAAGKHAFVEKPLALNEAQLADVMRTYESALENHGQVPALLTVGYNRRFSPISTLLKDTLRDSNEPLTMVYRINAGKIEPNSWVHDPEVGGGRIVGEICHFVDLMQFLTDAEPLEVFANSLATPHTFQADPDTVSAQIRFSDGSIGVISYAATGDPGFPKERIEVFGGGMTGVIDNWRSIQISGNRKRVRQRQWVSAAKGHQEELRAFASSIQTGVSSIDFRSLVLTSRTTFAMQKSLRTLAPVSIFR